MHRDNHYVPRSYLKRWTHGDLKVWSYRILVSHSRVPLWRESSTRGVAYHEHLYTKLAASGESDEIEHWLDADFETPAESAIERVISDRSLSPADWRLLIRFFAAQDVRTPARLVENLRRWSAELPALMQNTLQSSVTRFAALSSEERQADHGVALPDDDLPLRVTITRSVDEPGGWAKAETISGRGLWLWSMRHVLTSTLRVLYRHRWTILEPPKGMCWYTSDDPVIKLNFTSENDYTFGGGWGSTGTDLLLPLSPNHLLFTQVGKRVPRRGTRMDAAKATLVRRLIAEHAHRYVFAVAPDPFVERVRPRTVDPQALKAEALQWHHWHNEQSEADRQVFSDRATETKVT
jgi:hypothetical protein